MKDVNVKENFERQTNTWDHLIDNFKTIDVVMEFYKRELYSKDPYNIDTSDIAKKEIKKSKFEEIIDRNIFKKELKPNNIDFLKQKYIEENPQEYSQVRYLEITRQLIE